MYSITVHHCSCFQKHHKSVVMWPHTASTAAKSLHGPALPLASCNLHLLLWMVLMLQPLCSFIYIVYFFFSLFFIVLWACICTVTQAIILSFFSHRQSVVYAPICCVTFPPRNYTAGGNKLLAELKWSKDMEVVLIYNKCSHISL